MKWNRNFHTHTAFCDGKDMPVTMAKKALELGFDMLGFSSHSHTEFDESYCLSLEGAQVYKERIETLRKEFEGKLTILCGLEYDIYSDEEKTGWDYLIGSCHYIWNDGDYIPVDESADILTDAANQYYEGDIYALCEAYFEVVSQVVKRTGCDIIGHFDLIKKFNRLGEVLFDENDPRYVAAWKKALDALIPTGVPFEINTAPLSWGDEPYPSRAILEEIHARGGKITINSDSHRKETLNQGFDRAVEIAKEIGFTSLVSMSPDGPVDVALE